jgi:hypothetical protein
MDDDDDDNDRFVRALYGSSLSLVNSRMMFIG